MDSVIGHNGGPSIREGNWIAVSRDIIEHHIVGAGQPVEAADRNKGSFSRLESWLDLLMLANWAERKIDNHGVTTILQPGQTLAGRSYLAKRWNWSEKTVRTWLSRLEKELMIVIFVESKRGQSRGHVRNVISVCNWEKYQGQLVAEGPPLGPVEGHPRATQGPQKNKGTNKQGNKEERDSSASDDALSAFEAWNSMAVRLGLKQARSLTPDRRTKIKSRLGEHGGLAGWMRALGNIEKSAFLRGNNDRGWQATFDFLLQPSSFNKVVDGVYGNGAHAQPAGPKNNIREMANRAARGEPMRTEETADEFLEIEWRPVQ